MSSFLTAVALITVSVAAPDGLITSKTKLSLWTTAGVKSTTVHVDTTEGVVSLYGSVPTEAQRTLAAATAAEVSGVKSVRNLLQVVAAHEERATARADDQVKALVEKQLAAPPVLTGNRISVKTVDKGVVVLTGEARSYGDYLRALVRTDRVSGVRRVVSEVKTPSDFLEDERAIFWKRTKADAHAKASEVKLDASDLRTTTDVKVRLLTSASVPSTEISVDSDDGVVTLFGVVPTAAVKKAAGAEAAKASGVNRVDNQLEIVPASARKSVDAKDADIERALALELQGRVELQRVGVLSKNGIVRLTGTVPSGWDQLTALRVVRLSAGVRGVENELQIDDPATARRY